METTCIDKKGRLIPYGTAPAKGSYEPKSPARNARLLRRRSQAALTHYAQGHCAPQGFCDHCLGVGTETSLDRGGHRSLRSRSQIPRARGMAGSSGLGGLDRRHVRDAAELVVGIVGLLSFNLGNTSSRAGVTYAASRRGLEEWAAAAAVTCSLFVNGRPLEACFRAVSTLLAVIRNDVEQEPVFVARVRHVLHDLVIGPARMPRPHPLEIAARNSGRRMVLQPLRAAAEPEPNGRLAPVLDLLVSDRMLVRVAHRHVVAPVRHANLDPAADGADADDFPEQQAVIGDVLQAVARIDVQY